MDDGHTGATPEAGASKKPGGKDPKTSSEAIAQILSRIADLYFGGDDVPSPRFWSRFFSSFCGTVTGSFIMLYNYAFSIVDSRKNDLVIKIRNISEDIGDLLRKVNRINTDKNDEISETIRNINYELNYIHRDIRMNIDYSNDLYVTLVAFFLAGILISLGVAVLVAHSIVKGSMIRLYFSGLGVVIFTLAMFRVSNLLS